MESSSPDPSAITASIMVEPVFRMSQKGVPSSTISAGVRILKWVM